MASTPENNKGEERKGKKVKRVRKVMSLAKKMRVLEMLQNGESCTAVGRIFGVNESTIRTIKKNEKAIRGSASRGTPESLRNTYITRNANLERMERELHEWLMEQKRNNQPLSVYIIRQRASQKCKLRFESGDKSIKFIASNGWLDRFKKRYSFYENKWLLDEVDEEAAAEYPEHLKKLIEEKNYLPQQVFNADEAVLFWKRMPKCTSIAKDEGRSRGSKPSKDKLKVLLCANASGDFLMRPMLLHRFRNPCPLKKGCSQHASIFMKGNHKIWITEKLFLYWLLNCFVPEVRQYLDRIGLPFKVLLILDSAPADKSALINANPHVQVICIPPKTTPLLQPLHLGALKMLKVYYTRCVLDYLADALTQTPASTLKEAWHSFSICTALTMMEEAVREIKPETLNGAWEKLWKEVVIKSEEPISMVEEINHIVACANRLGVEGFQDIEAQDIAQLLDSHPQKIVEKYFQDVIGPQDGPTRQAWVAAEARRRVNDPLCNSNNSDDDSKEGILEFRQGFNDYPSPCRALIRNLPTKANKALLSVCFNREEEAGPSGYAGSDSEHDEELGPRIQIVEVWESDIDIDIDIDSSDENEFFKLEEESGAED
ncbi:PREDICTED: tigger transposable element-derived protein 1-like [Elephantulus edwardii]|uniref:tigger transposable element-derived protein 1-like n=1 Tax=Elephantulus edwardii TaxID=28737 RepID=UPI0003F0661D|nr:PREDICTED: tigger transposable element-derived protein 1-like [Elephantulus edwardii]